MGKFKDLSEKKFSRLTVVGMNTDNKCNKNNVMWDCVCECGGKTITSSYSLNSGHTKSCGCLQIESATKHGMYKTQLYSLWFHIKERCTSENCNNFHRYGGRGIKMCDEWINDPLEFIKWCKNNGYKKGLQIDRIDNDGNYEPSNCRFVKAKINARNRSNNHIIKYNGKEMCISEWAEYLGISNQTILSRIRAGHTPEKALSTEIMDTKEKPNIRIEDIENLMKKGYSINKCAIHFNCDWHTIKRRIDNKTHATHI